MAKVMALKDYQDELNKTRDYFVAETWAAMLNSNRHKESDKVFTSSELLNTRYGSVSITDGIDPDLGAVCSVDFGRGKQ